MRAVGAFLSLRLWVCALVICTPGTLLFADSGVPDAAEALAGISLVQALQRGGLTVYFRHADTGPAYSEPRPIDLNRCETQRNLNENGRLQARVIGEQFRRLNIPVGDILSSEFCRCWQTAELAFGRYRKVSALTGVSRDPEAAADRRASAEALRKLLGTVPASNTNTVLVSHGYNLFDLEQFLLGTQGEAAVYRPDGRGGYALVARVTPDEWAKLAGDAK